MLRSSCLGSWLLVVFWFSASKSPIGVSFRHVLRWSFGDLCDEALSYCITTFRAISALGAEVSITTLLRDKDSAGLPSGFSGVSCLEILVLLGIALGLFRTLLEVFVYFCESFTLKRGGWVKITLNRRYKACHDELHIRKETSDVTE